MDFNNPIESAFDVLDYALQEIYAENDSITGIYYNPDWVNVLKEVMINTENLKGHSGKEIAEKILELFWLAVQEINGCACVGRRSDVLQPFLPV